MTYTGDLTRKVSAPRTRGWFPQLAQCEPATVVGPAHAGMVRGRGGDA